VLSCDGHMVDIPRVRPEARGGQAEAFRHGRWITCPGQQELGPYLAARGEQMVSSFFRFMLLLAPQGCPSSLTCMYSFAGSEDRRDTKLIWPFPKVQDQEGAAS
jgi:hypothetical protein